MSAPVWPRRRIGDTVTYDAGRHSQGWRQCANDDMQREVARARDDLDSARGMLVAASVCLLCWLALAGLLWWSVAILAD